MNYKSTLNVILSTLLLSTGMAVQAANTSLQDRVQHAVAQAQIQKPKPEIIVINWGDQVKHVERTLEYHTEQGKKIVTPSFKQLPVKRKHEVFNARLGKLRKAVANNSVIKGYQVVVPDPEVLISMNEADLNKAVRMFESHKMSLYNFVPCSRPVKGVVAISMIQEPVRDHIHVLYNLWIDVTTHKVYVLKGPKYYGIQP